MTFRVQHRNIEALDSVQPFDVCIVGSGPAGTVLGTRLVRAGIRTLILESGKGLSEWLCDTRLRGLAAYDFTGDADYPLTKTKARLVGGNSNFWTGRCERFHPSDFDRHPYTPADNPWPISYRDLVPFYERAEATLRVRGGKLSHGAPPRESDLPLSPSPDISYLRTLLSRAGVGVNDSPTATPSKGIRFFKVNKEILPEYVSAAPYGSLVTGVTVTRLMTDSDRRVCGAEVRTFDGYKKTARARVFVLCGGGIENPRLLLLSKSDSFPDGIGNSSDRVGRGFNEHPNVNFYARIPHELGTIVPTNKIGRTHQFYGDFRSEGLGSVLPVFRQAWVLPHHVMPFRLSRLPRNIAATFLRVFKAPLFIGANLEMNVDPSNRVTLSESRNDLFGNPIAHLNLNFTEEDRRLVARTGDLIRGIFEKVGATGVFESEVAWSRHHQGTCRMGNNPSTSVVDRNLRVHDCENLYVCGSDVFVTGGAMPPALTIVALAHRLGDHLTSRLREQAG